MCPWDVSSMRPNLLQALHRNPIERGLFGPADDSSKHDPLGRAEPDFWGFHQSNVPS
jgi:hypothetical protein